jgi:uncharacterized protein YoxC
MTVMFMTEAGRKTGDSNIDRLAAEYEDTYGMPLSDAQIERLSFLSDKPEFGNYAIDTSDFVSDAPFGSPQRDSELRDFTNRLIAERNAKRENLTLETAGLLPDQPVLGGPDGPGSRSRPRSPEVVKDRPIFAPPNRFPRGRPPGDPGFARTGDGMSQRPGTGVGNYRALPVGGGIVLPPMTDQRARLPRERLPRREKGRPRRPSIFSPRVSDDLAAAQEEYGSTVSPFADLSQFLNRPVFDRGSLPEMQAPTLSEIGTAQANVKRPFPGFIDTGMADRIGRNQEISNLRDALRQDISTSEEAARSERSDITKSLEDRIAELRTGVDTETEALRQAGVDERAGLLRQIEEGDRLVREAQEAAIGSLQDAQGGFQSDVQSRIESLTGDLANINSAIDSQYQTLNEQQKAAADSTSAEIDTLNQQLEQLYGDVTTGVTEQTDEVRAETAGLVQDLEQRINTITENFGALPIESIQAELSAVNDRTAQFQQSVDVAAAERADLAQQIAQIQQGGLTQADLSAALSPIEQQRQQAIASAIDPIQQQIEALRGEIPQQQNIDVDALRQQITEQVMSQLPQQQTTPAVTTGAAEGQQGVSVEPEGDVYADLGPSSSEAAGYNPAVTANISDGRADAMGFFDDPRPMQQFNQTPGVRDTVAVPTMRGNQMTGRTGPFIPDMRDIMQGVDVRGVKR